MQYLFQLPKQLSKFHFSQNPAKTFLFQSLTYFESTAGSFSNSWPTVISKLQGHSMRGYNWPSSSSLITSSEAIPMGSKYEIHAYDWSVGEGHQLRLGHLIYPWPPFASQHLRYNTYNEVSIWWKTPKSGHICYSRIQWAHDQVLKSAVHRNIQRQVIFQMFY